MYAVQLFGSPIQSPILYSNVLKKSEKRKKNEISMHIFCFHPVQVVCVCDGLIDVFHYSEISFSFHSIFGFGCIHMIILVYSPGPYYWTYRSELFFLDSVNQKSTNSHTRFTSRETSKKKSLVDQIYYPRLLFFHIQVHTRWKIFKLIWKIIGMTIQHSSPFFWLMTITL